MIAVATMLGFLALAVSVVPVGAAAAVPVQAGGQLALESGLEALRRGDVVTAISALEAAVAAAPDDVQPAFHLGRARLQAGDFAGAAAELRRAQALDPGFDPAVGYQLGVALMRATDYDGATDAFNEVLVVQPEATPVRLNLGWVAMQQQQSELALYHFERVLRVDDRIGLAHYYIGVVHHGAGRFVDAEVAYGQALLVEPSLQVARLALGRLSADTGDPERARRLYEQVILEAPQLADAHFQLGVLRMRGGNLEAAIEELERAVTLDPGHEGALYNLGLAYRRAGRPVASTAELETFAVLRGAAAERERAALRGAALTRAETDFQRGLEALEAGDTAAAGTAFRVAIDTAGEDATGEMHLALGALRLAQGWLGEARAALEEAVAVDAELAEAYRLLAEAYERLDRDDDAAAARKQYERIVANRRSRQK